VKQSASEVTYDAEADRAYVHVAPTTGDGSMKRVLVDDDALPGPIVVDLDGSGRVLGFELVKGSRSLPLKLLHELR